MTDTPKPSIDLASVKANMILLGELEWSQTPWDSLSKEELIFLVTSLHVAASNMVRILERADASMSGMEREQLSGWKEIPNYIYTGWFPSDMNVDWHGQEYTGKGGYSEEGEAFWRLTHRPVSDMLAFEGSQFTSWICDICKDGIGVGPESKGPHLCHRDACNKNPMRLMRYGDRRPIL